MKETIRVTPDMTHGELARRTGRYFFKELLLPSSFSMIAQDAIIALEKGVFGELMQPKDWLGGLPYTDKLPALSTPVTTLLMFAGAFLGEHLAQAKIKVGQEPEKLLPSLLWHGSIVTQFTAAGESLGKIIFQAPEIWNHMVENAQFFLGDLACLASGAVALADNFRPRTEDHGDLRNMIPSTIAMISGVGGFMMAPIEDKPVMAGLTVAVIANFVENSLEMDWPAAMKNAIKNIRNIPIKKN